MEVRTRAAGPRLLGTRIRSPRVPEDALEKWERGGKSGEIWGGGGMGSPNTTEARGQQQQSNDPGNNQHILNTPIIGRR